MSINDAIHFLPINVISVIIFALATLFLVYILPFLFIFSLFGWSISQPWLVLNNIYQRWHKKQILNNDKSYCRTHDRSDDTLHKEMKYEESFVAHCSSYVTQMNQLQMQTEWQAKKYSKVVNDHVTLFPQDDTANMGHLLHIFQAIETGKATSWKDASVFVAQYEQQDRNTQTLAHAINQSTHQIVNTVNQARDQMMNQFASEMSEISGQIEHETNAINYWGGVQTSIAAYQTDLMQKANNR